MNTFALVPAIRKEPSQMGEHYLDIEIDEKPLAHHFAGLLGTHPSEIPSFGWDKRPGKLSEYEMGELLGVNTLESGRVPVLSCAFCGGIESEAFAVRILIEGHHVR